MAYYDLDPDSGFYRICFRFPPSSGKRYKRSRELKIRDEQRADAVCGIVQETIRDLMRGVITVPEGVDPGDFILSGGKLTTKPVVAATSKALTLQGMLDQYAASGVTKEDSTHRTEWTHFKHLIRILGPDSVLDRLEKNDIQKYVDSRAAETYERTGEKTKTQTIKKELGTLSVAWTWAKDAGEVKSVPKTQKFLAFASWCARLDLTQPFASVLAALVQGVRGPDASGPVPHCAASLPVSPTPALPAATNSSHGACNGPTPPSR